MITISGIHVILAEISPICHLGLGRFGGFLGAHGQEVVENGVVIQDRGQIECCKACQFDHTDFLRSRSAWFGTYARTWPVLVPFTKGVKWYWTEVGIFRGVRRLEPALVIFGF